MSHKLKILCQDYRKGKHNYYIFFPNRSSAIFCKGNICVAEKSWTTNGVVLTSKQMISLLQFFKIHTLFYFSNDILNNLSKMVISNSTIAMSVEVIAMSSSVRMVVISCIVLLVHPARRSIVQKVSAGRQQQVKSIHV